jgi:hypothetical protein
MGLINYLEISLHIEIKKNTLQIFVTMYFQQMWRIYFKRWTPLLYWDRVI